MERILFSNKERDTIKDILTQKGFLNRVCEVCKTDIWLIDDRAISFSVAIWSPDGQVGGDMYSSHRPSVAVVCKNCGNTKLFNLGQMGFTKQFGEDEEDVDE